MTVELRPFQEGDRVVLCPRFTKATLRGSVGTVRSVYNAIDVEVTFDDLSHESDLDRKAAGSGDMIRPTYYYRPVDECESCVFRSFHVIGTSCPVDFADIRKIGQQNEEEGQAATAAGTS